jgi:Holliday junction resolvase RusA-like endonuclease
VTLGLVPPEPLAEAVVVDVTVRGAVVGQGSMRGFADKYGHVHVVPDNPRDLKAWRTRIAQAAQEAMAERPIIRGPVRVQARFVFARPKSHYGKRGLLPSAPAFRTGGVDLDKACRALLDAISSVIVSDDSLVTEMYVVKTWGEEPGLRLRVTVL